MNRAEMAAAAATIQNLALDIQRALVHGEGGHPTETRPPPEPEPTRPPPADTVEWATEPPVTVSLEEKGKPVQTFETHPGFGGRWTEEGDMRHISLYAELCDLSLFITHQQWRGIDATMTTVIIANGFEKRGTAYLSAMRVAVGRSVYEREQHDCIDPRRPLIFRFFTGPQDDTLRDWDQITLPRPAPEWVADLAFKGAASAMDRSTSCGPFILADPTVKGSSSLNGSHGGWRLGCSWAQTIATSAEGFDWLTWDWRATAMRSPICLLERGTGKWKNPHAAYWPGSTVEHEPPGYEITTTPNPGGMWQWKQPLMENGKPWCSYETELREFRAHDHTHGIREDAAAAAVAKDDVSARWWLTISWGNAAAWLDGHPWKPGQTPAYHLLQSYPEMLALSPTGKGDSRGGRGWGHILGRYVLAEPWLKDFPAPTWGGTWKEALQALTKHWAMPGSGWTHAAPKEDFAIPADAWGSMENPVTAPRELFLTGVWYEKLGLSELYAKIKESLAPLIQGSTEATTSTAEHIEVRPNFRHWYYGLYRNPNAQVQYDGFFGRVETLGGWDKVLSSQANTSPEEFLLANVPIEIWQEEMAK